MSTDPVELLRSLLAANWVAANTDSVAPFTADSGIDGRKVSGSQKRITVKAYRGQPVTMQKVGHSGAFYTREDRVTLDINIFPPAPAGTLRTHMEKVMDEARRVIETKRINPDAFWDWMMFEGFSMPVEFEDGLKTTGTVLFRAIWKPMAALA